MPRRPAPVAGPDEAVVHDGRTAAKGAAYVHTLSASGLAASRLVPALLGQHQRPDGTFAVPEVLRHWGLPEVLRRP